MSENKSNGDLQVASATAVQKELGLASPANVAAKDLGKENEEQLSHKADAFIEALLKLDPKEVSDKNDGKTSIENMGLDLQRKAMQTSEMLKQPIKNLSKKAEDGGDVANALVNLKMEVEQLDPSRFDFEAGWFSRTLGMLPGVGTPLKRYFSKYESAQTVIAAIIKSLEVGRDQLHRDNVTLLEDQKQMNEVSKKLEQTIALMLLIDQKLQYKMDRELQAGTDQHRFVGEEILFPLRQRVIDLQQQLAVNHQGVLATEIIMRNNKELMRGVNRALSVTVTALQVGATVAMALANQKVVLDKMESVNKTTSDLIASTAARLKTQGTAIHKQASSAQLDMESLKGAFRDIQTAMDDISSFRLNALPQMANSVLELDRLTNESRKAIDKMEQGNRQKPKLEIDIG